MTEDCVMQEIRDIRRQMLEEHGNDWDKLFQHYLRAQAEYAKTHALIRGGPRRVTRAGSLK